MIRTYRDKRIAQIAAGKSPKGFPADLLATTRRKLYAIEHADELEDLRSPPGNRLELLRGNRDGQYSIRVNDQWRICFHWFNGGADNVEIVDDH